MYFFFRPDFSDEKKLMRFTGTMYYNGQKFEKSLFDDGNLIDEKTYENPFIVIVDETDSAYKKKKLTDRVLLSAVSAGKMRLVSPRFVELIRENKISNIQFFDVEIKASDFELNDYKLMNIVGKYDCMDEKKSEVELDDDGDIYDLVNLVLDENRIPENQQIFLLGRDTGAVILVHEHLKKIIEDKKLTGIDFQILDDR